LEGIKYIETIGGKAVQVFLGSTLSSSIKMKRKISDSEALEIKKYIRNNNIYLVVHSIYLLNFCSYPSPPHKDSKRIKYAIDNT
jgi:endonuclease IV